MGASQRHFSLCIHKWSVTRDMYPGKYLCITSKSQGTAHLFHISLSSRAFLVIVIVMSVCRLLWWGRSKFFCISLVFHRKNFCLPWELDLLKSASAVLTNTLRNAQKPTDFNVVFLFSPALGPQDHILVTLWAAYWAFSAPRVWCLLPEDRLKSGSCVLYSFRKHLSPLCRMQNESCLHVLAWKTFIKCLVKFWCTLGLPQDHSVNQPAFVLCF